ncbi:MAG TPA: phosphoribosylformylglycinamidine synthase subunit PurL [Anaerolineae bacterium]|nr:phosphoribosylformylglycinamidine synthase subunit PurL [Anaerolineae bacterium]
MSQAYRENTAAGLQDGPVTIYRIEVLPRSGQVEETGNALVRAAHQLGLTQLQSCLKGQLFFLQGQLTAANAHHLAQELLADPVTETYIVHDLSEQLAMSNEQLTNSSLPPFDLAQGQPSNPPILQSSTLPPFHAFIEITLLPGVTDPAAENLVRAAHLLGLTGLTQAATGQRYLLAGSFDKMVLQRLATGVFSNPVIQQFALNQPIQPPFVAAPESTGLVEVISMRQASDQALLEISSARRLALNLAEMQAIQAYFEKEARDPTDVELEMLAQTWSEHCVHKTFKATIHYIGPKPGAPPDAPPEKQIVSGLLKSYIRSATEKLRKPWIRSTFVDNAGIIAFDQNWDLAFKVETHNHPSALEPFGGANTGVGGVVRDILGVSARPIANTDILCFGPPDLAEAPAGVLHPRRIADGVVHGIEDYGNKMGIPTVNGAIVYHPGYTANPLVFCGCLGLLPHGSHVTEAQAGDLVVVIGGRTGRDGLRGATFSSMEMDQTTGQIAGSAVQIGHPIHEKQVQEVILRARDEQLYHAITDCGAGGLSSAVGEMAEGLGATVQLETVPLKYPGLIPWEIWLSEAQERMVLAVSPDHWPRFQEICAGQDVEAVSIRHFEATGRLQLRYKDRLVGDLDLGFLHDGIPLGRLEAVWSPPRPKRKSAKSKSLKATPDTFSDVLLRLLAWPTIRSKEDVIRRYDHEVQSGTALKPLVGVDNHGPGDAAVLVPLDVQVGRGTSARNSLAAVSRRAVALANGVCPHYGELDPYAMAWAAIDEALRNLVAVGVDPDRVAILDNFCWGNPNLPDRLGSLVRCAQGCYDAALAYRTPFISGKDSLNNEYLGADGQKHAIPGTLLISAVGIVPDVTYTSSMDLKRPGNLLYLVGDTRAELGGSHYQLVINNDQLAISNEQKEVHNSQFTIHNSQLIPPQPVPGALKRLRTLHRAMSMGLVQACHDCSEGGLAVALAEMCLAGRLGARINLSKMALNLLTDEQMLFAESLTRFVIEVRPEDSRMIEQLLTGLPYTQIGHVNTDPRLQIYGQAGGLVIDAAVSELESAWRGSSAPGSKGAKTQRRSRVPTQPLPQPSSPPTLQSANPPSVLILHATGTNRDRDAALACELAGGVPEIVHINQILAGERDLLNYAMLVVPGGFSYGDDLGAGVLWALDLRQRLEEKLARFVASGRPVLGICNGFQALVKAGILPGVELDDDRRSVTLAPNARSHFECRWVYLRPNPASPCLFTEGLTELIYCPVAHGEGRLAVANDETLFSLQKQQLHALTYVRADGSPVDYPANPNGSVANIAGLTNPAGNILGLMPHPENHIFPWHHPRRHRGEQGLSGLRLFENGLKRA